MSTPWASGDQTIWLIPRSRLVGTTAPSITRHSAEYWGWLLIKPMPSHVLLTAVHALLGTAPASLPSAEAAPVPDWDEGAAMLALNGQNAHVMALRELFIKELPDVHAAVSTALQQNDTSALRVQLHRLQASCGFVGASRLGRAVRQLHQAPESAMAQRQFEAAASALLRR